jgi:cyclopropane fatty-acyl-phospholipid synthase-like methyltransferase
MNDQKNIFEKMYSENNMPWDSDQPEAELIRQLDLKNLPGKTLLEIGCGTGTNTIELARRGYEITALDFVPKAVDLAREKAKKAGVNIQFQVGDVLQADLKGPYDILFDRGVYHHLRHADLNGFQSFLKRVTRPGTRWLSFAGNSKEKQDPGPPTVSEDEIRSELGSLFNIIELKEFRFTTHIQGFKPLAWSILLERKSS